METEEFLGSLLYFRNGEIQLSYLENIRKYLEKVQTIALDLSEADICLTVKCMDEYFVMEKTKIELTDYYKEYSEKIKSKFFDRMNTTKKEYFWKLLDAVE